MLRLKSALRVLAATHLHMENFLYLTLGIVLGGAVGWLAAGRKGGAGRGELVGELRQQIERKEQEVGEVERREKDQRDDLAAARERLVRAEAQLKASQDRLIQQEESLTRSMAQMRETFTNLSTETLKQTQPQIMQLMEKTMAQYRTVSQGDMAHREEAIATLIKPLEEQLKIYQLRLQQSENNRSEALGDIKKHLDVLAHQSETLSSETLQLRRVLSSSQARGRWGEETLRRVVEVAGLSQHCEFREQVKGEEGTPDLVVQLPGERLILVDSKVPDFDFLTTLEQADDLKRKAALTLHATKMKATIKALADRDYPKQFPGSLDYVVCFLPAESLFSAALEGDRDLIVWAAERRILLSTPASLIALLRSVSVSWQQHEQTVNARRIAEVAEELFSRVATFTNHFDNIRSGLERASKAYNEAVGSYERSVRPSGERLLKLGVPDAGKDWVQGEMLEESLRPVTTGKKLK